MTKIKLLFIFLILTNLVIAQSKQSVKIPETKYSLVPPKGFVLSQNFSGFQNMDLGASIMVTEISAPFIAINEGFTAEALKTKGMTLINKNSIDFNNSKATFITVSQVAQGITYLKQMLIFGDDKNTVMVNGIYPEVNKRIEQDLKSSILSIVYDRDQDSASITKYTINVEDTPFKLTKSMTGSVMYTTDGKIPSDKPLLITSTSISQVHPQNQKQFCITRLKSLPLGEHNQVKSIERISVSGLDGYEIVADGKNKHEQKEMVYQTILFHENGDYFMIVGLTTVEFDSFLNTFKKVARTFVLR